MQNNNFNVNDDDFIIGKGFSVSEPDQNKKGNKRRRKKGLTVIKNVIWILSIFVEF